MTGQAYICIDLCVTVVYIMWHFDLLYSDDQIGQTPLCVASYHGYEGVVEYLIQAGADIDGKFTFSKSEDNAVNWKVQYTNAS